MDGRGTTDGGGDRRIVVATGPFRMEPGETQEIVYAIVWARGADRLDSITKLRQATRAIRETYMDLMQPNNPPPREDEPVLPAAAALSRSHPNPFGDRTTIRYDLPDASRVTLAVYDALGRTIEVLVDARQEAGAYRVDFDASGLPAGLYVYRLTLNGHHHTARPMIHTR